MGITYETDKEKLSRETEWIREIDSTKNGKKMGESKYTHSSQKKSAPASRTQDIEVANRLQLQQKNMRKPPPIVIGNLITFPQLLILCHKLFELAT